MKKSKNIENVNKLKSMVKSFGAITALFVGGWLLFTGSGVGHSYMVTENTRVASKLVTVKTADKNRKKKTSYNASLTKSIDSKEIWRAKQYPVNPVGRMSIPVVNIHNPLFEGYGDHNQNLSFGVVSSVAGRRLGAPNTNVCYAGHYMGNYGAAILDNLHYVKPGDVIYLTDMHRIYAYKANSIAFDIKPNQVEVENNQKGKSLVTLITCSDFDINKYGYGKHRTVVQGELIGSVPATKTNLVKTELTDKDNQPSMAKAKKQKRVYNPVTKKVVYIRKAAQPKVTQNITYTQILTTVVILYFIILIGRFAYIWLK